MTLAQTIQESYDQLGLHSGASLTDVKIAYRRLAKQHHPDRNQGAFASVMARINQAYQQLNQHLSQSEQSGTRAYAFEEFQAQAGSRPKARAAGRPQADKAAPPSPAAVVQAYAPMGQVPAPAQARDQAAYEGQIKAGPVGVTMNRSAGWRLMGLEKQGEDLVYRVEVKGDANELNLPVRRVSPCRLCQGSGFRHVHGLRTICPACAGQGKTTRSRMVRANLPADWAPGRRFPVPAGEPGSYIWVEPIVTPKAREV